MVQAATASQICVPAGCSKFEEISASHQGPVPPLHVSVTPIKKPCTKVCQVLVRMDPTFPWKGPSLGSGKCRMCQLSISQYPISVSAGQFFYVLLYHPQNVTLENTEEKDTFPEVFLQLFPFCINRSIDCSDCCSMLQKSSKNVSNSEGLFVQGTSETQHLETPWLSASGKISCKNDRGNFFRWWTTVHTQE